MKKILLPQFTKLILLQAATVLRAAAGAGGQGPEESGGRHWGIQNQPGYFHEFIFK